MNNIKVTETTYTVGINYNSDNGYFDVWVDFVIDGHNYTAHVDINVYNAKVNSIMSIYDLETEDEDEVFFSKDEIAKLIDPFNEACYKELSRVLYGADASWELDVDDQVDNLLVRLSMPIFGYDKKSNQYCFKSIKLYGLIDMDELNSIRDKEVLIKVTLDEMREEIIDGFNAKIKEGIPFFEILEEKPLDITTAELVDMFKKEVRNF